MSQEVTASIAALIAFGFIYGITWLFNGRL